jgi:dephospho-CoA kinase
MFRIGVTGGIGSGKSLVCSLFARLGVPVLSADLLAKQLMINDPELRSELISILGRTAYEPDGTLNRRHIASRIFWSRAVRKRMNAAVHPRVEKHLDRQLAELEREGQSMAIVEAALIFEAGYDRKLDAVVVVHSSERERIRRVAERDDISLQEVRQRARSQWSTAKKIQQADYVLHNDGSREDLDASVRFLHSLFTTITDKK